MTTRLRFLTLVPAAAMAASACAEPPVHEQPPTPVTVSRAASSATGATVRYSATVKPRVEVGLAFKVSGYVEDLLTVPGDRGVVRDVQEGDYVEKGAALARVRESDFQQKVDQIRSGVAEAQAMADNARQDLERATRLFERQSLTKPELDAARARADAMAARVEGARAGLREAELLLGDAVLRAPLSGVVLSRAIQRGSLVAPGTPAFVIADTTAVKVAFGVPDVVVRQLTIGRPQQLTFEALRGESFDGRITSIAPAPDPVSRVYQIEVTVPNPRRRLEVGFIAVLELGDRPGQAVTTVPLEAIVKPASGSAPYAVYVLEEKDGQPVARLRPVSLGEVVGSAMTITEGLAADQPVIVRGATLMVDGQRVRVVP